MLAALQTAEAAAMEVPQGEAPPTQAPPPQQTPAQLLQQPHQQRALRKRSLEELPAAAAVASLGSVADVGTPADVLGTSVGATGPSTAASAQQTKRERKKRDLDSEMPEWHPMRDKSGVRLRRALPAFLPYPCAPSEGVRLLVGAQTLRPAAVPALASPPSTSPLPPALPHTSTSSALGSPSDGSPSDEPCDESGAVDPTAHASSPDSRGSDSRGCTGAAAAEVRVAAGWVAEGREAAGGAAKQAAAAVAAPCGAAAESAEDDVFGDALSRGLHMSRTRP